jgi:alpha-tubulin suppressor-like RCC1 family protein
MPPGTRSDPHSRFEKEAPMIRPSLTKASFYSGSPLSRLSLSALMLLSVASWASPAFAQESVAWTQAWGTAASGSSLMKIGPEGWNAGAVSAKSLASGNGALEFVAGPAADVVCGLTSRPGALGYETIEFALRLDANGVVAVVESGVARTTASPFTPGDRFRIAVEAGGVRYYKNGLLLFASGVAVSYPLSAKAALGAAGATIGDVVLSGNLLENVLWTNGVNVTAWGSDLAKSAGAAGKWDAGAISTRAIVSMDGYVELVASPADGNRMIGLSNGDRNASYEDIDFAIALEGSSLEIREAGVSRGISGSYAVGDRLRVAVENGTIRYRQNGRLLYESAVVPSFPLLVDSSLDTPGSVLAGAVLSGELVDVALAPPVFSAPTGHYATAQSVVVISPDPLATIHYTTNGADPTEADDVMGTGQSLLIDKDVVLKARAWRESLIASGVTAATYTFGSVSRETVAWKHGVNVTAAGSDLAKSMSAREGWDAGAVSTRAIVSMDGYVEFTASEKRTCRALGLSRGETDQSLADVDFGLSLCDSKIGVSENGILRGPFGSFATGDRLRVAIENGAIKYRKNGRLLFESNVAPNVPLLVDTALYDSGSTLKRARLSGELEDAVVRGMGPNAAAAPTIAPPGGLYTTPQTVTITAESGAVIRYTLNGNIPTVGSPIYFQPLAVNSPKTLKARAWVHGVAGDVATAVYAFQVAAPVMSQPGGPFTAPVTVALTSTTPGAAIYYTTNGVDPTEPGLGVAYTAPLTIGTFTNLRARAFRTSWTPSALSEAIYQFNYGTLPAPTIEPVPPILEPPYTTSVQVSILCEGFLCSILNPSVYYTVDGSDPTTSPTRQLYTDVFTLEVSATVRAVTSRVDWTTSAVAEKYFEVKVAAPVFSPVGGTYAASQDVAITTETPGAQVTYTTDGTDPSESGPPLAPGQTIHVDGSITIRARAWKDFTTPSDIVSATYSVSHEVVAAGDAFTLVLKRDGTVLAFGDNTAGQLGVSTPALREVPAPVPGLPAVVGIAAGFSHGIAVTSSKEVWTWGSNGDGQLGAVPPSPSRAPAVVNGLTDVAAVAAGGMVSAALKDDGTLLLWGDNSNGQIGVDDPDDQPTPVPVMADVAEVAVGRYHVIARKRDGSVWAWGANGSGQLGDGTTTGSRTPVRVIGLPSVARIDAGYNHSLALGGNGWVWAWGDDHRGQLGDAPAPVARTTGRSTPMRIAGIVGASGIAAGYQHTLITKTDGSAWACGDNAFGQLGDGTGLPSGNNPNNEPLKLPVRVVDLPSIVAVAAGGNSSFAVSDDDAIWGWGQNSRGQLGDGTTENRLRPVSIAGPGSTRRTATPTFSLAPGIHNDELDVAISSLTPGATIHYEVNRDEDPTAASPEYVAPVHIYQSTVLKARAFGPGMPESGVGVATYTLRPVKPAFTPEGWGYLSAPITVQMSTTPLDSVIYYTIDGTEPTLGAPSTLYAVPVAIGSSLTLQAKAFRNGWMPSVTHVSRYFFSLGTLPPPVIAPAGDTYLAPLEVVITAGELTTIRYTTNTTEPGPSSPVYSPSSPILLTANTTIKAAAFRADWTTSSTAVQVYDIKPPSPSFSLEPGKYPIGQALVLSDADPDVVIRYTLDDSDPVATSTGVAPGTTLNLMRNVTFRAAAYKANCVPSDVTAATYTVEDGTLPAANVAGGDYYSLARLSDGGVWSWGSNDFGQLGASGITQRLEPGAIPALTNAPILAAGAAHGIAIDAGGQVKAWGRNGYGQLGDDTTTNRAAPMPVLTLGPGSVSSVAAGQEHSLALRTDGTVVAWGQNSSGQLGDGSTTPMSKVPVPVSVADGEPLTDVATIDAGTMQSLAVKADGTVVGWGNNEYGQVGNGTTTTPQTRPVTVEVDAGVPLSGVSRVAGGSWHSLALKTDGTVWSWGSNGWGQLGIDSPWYSTRAVRVPGLTGVVAIAAGGLSSLALRSDGTIWAWGANDYGQLGTGTGTSSSSPVLVANVRSGIAIGAGQGHGLAVTLDGVVWAWGAGGAGQIGDGTTTFRRLTPVPLSASGGLWKAATPVLSYTSGTYSSELDVVVSCATDGATIHYTLNGPDPTLDDPTVASGSAVHIASTRTLKARAFNGEQPPSELAEASYALTVPTPGFSFGAGTYAADLMVSISSIGGATIRFTPDGPDPDEGSAEYTSPIPITQTATLKARAWRTDWSSSGVGTQTYTMKVATPTLTPDGGIASSATPVSITSTTAGAEIHYTLDGREPTLLDPVVIGAVVVDRSTTLRATAWRAGWSASDTSGATYFVTVGSAAAPVSDPPAGVYGAPQRVTLTSVTAGATIRYTLDGSEPTRISPAYRRPITISETTTLKARAMKPDVADSPTLTAEYTITVDAALMPQFTPAGGRYRTTRQVTVTCPTSGSVVHYTLNTLTSRDPLESDPEVTCGGSITVDRSSMLKARAWKAGLAPSAVRQADYEITGMVAGGGAFSLALDSTGRVWSWGYNGSGQLGDGPPTGRSAPGQLPAFSSSPVEMVAAGGSHSLAVTQDGSVWAWGLNDNGQLGNGGTTNEPAPVELPASAFDMKAVVAVTAGPAHSLAITEDGRVWAWGDNSSGNLGDGTTTSRTTPVQVAAFGTAPVVAVAAGFRFSLALASDGTVWSWGTNNYGDLGDGSSGWPRTTPDLVPGLSAIDAIATGFHRSMALRSDGVVWAWGYYIGDGSWLTRLRPVRVPLSAPAALVVTGSSHSLTAVRESSGAGGVLAWGANTSGWLGDGSYTQRLAPVRVFDLEHVTGISAGDAHSLAVALDGAVWAWGDNSYGRLGSEAGATATSPTRVSGLQLVDNSWLTADPDADGLMTGVEQWLGTDPLVRDTNGDGIDDGVAVALGTSAVDPDVDHDGLTNVQELALGTDPFNPDTDGDGVIDGLDAFPLDPTQWEAQPVPTDHNPPTITLSRPPDARLVP